MIKEDTEAARAVCTAGLNALRMVMIYLMPITPKLTAKCFAFLNCTANGYADLDDRLVDHSINTYIHLAKRLELKDVDLLIK